MGSNGSIFNVLQNGFVGIGTTSPSSLLSIQGIGNFVSAATSTLYTNLSFPYFTSTSTIATSSIAGALYVASSTPTQNALLAVGTSTPLLFVNRDSGNVGIGTTGPNMPLVIRKDSAATAGAGALKLVNLNTTVNNFTGIELAGADTAGVERHTWLINAIRDDPAATIAGSDLQFTSGGTGGGEINVMRLTNAGNVGIGDATPDTLLDVEGNIAADNYIAIFFNDGNNANRRGIKTVSGADDASGTNYAISFDDGDGTGQGDITFSAGTVTYGAFTANHDVRVPEEYNEKGYPYGTLLCVKSIFYGNGQERGINYDTEACNDGSYSKRVLGAYAGKYENEENKHQVYILGDGHIRVNNEGGNIEIGDPITTSSQARRNRYESHEIRPYHRHCSRKLHL